MLAVVTTKGVVCLDSRAAFVAIPVDVFDTSSGGGGTSSLGRSCAHSTLQLIRRRSQPGPESPRERLQWRCWCADRSRTGTVGRGLLTDTRERKTRNQQGAHRKRSTMTPCWRLVEGCVCVYSFLRGSGCLLGDIENLLDDAVEVDALEVALSFAHMKSSITQQVSKHRATNGQCPSRNNDRLATHRFHLLHRVQEHHDRVEEVVLALQAAHSSRIKSVSTLRRVRHCHSGLRNLTGTISRTLARARILKCGGRPTVRTTNKRLRMVGVNGRRGPLPRKYDFQNGRSRSLSAGSMLSIMQQKTFMRISASDGRLSDHSLPGRITNRNTKSTIEKLNI